MKRNKVIKTLLIALGILSLPIMSSNNVNLENIGIIQEVSAREDIKTIGAIARPEYKILKPSREATNELKYLSESANYYNTSFTMLKNNTIAFLTVNDAKGQLYLKLRANDGTIKEVELGAYKSLTDSSIQEDDSYIYVHTGNSGRCVYRVNKLTYDVKVVNPGTDYESMVCINDRLILAGFYRNGDAGEFQIGISDTSSFESVRLNKEFAFQIINTSKTGRFKSKLVQKDNKLFVEIGLTNVKIPTLSLYNSDTENMMYYLFEVNVDDSGTASLVRSSEKLSTPVAEYTYDVSMAVSWQNVRNTDNMYVIEVKDLDYYKNVSSYYCPPVYSLGKGLYLFEDDGTSTFKSNDIVYDEYGSTMLVLPEGNSIRQIDTKINNGIAHIGSDKVINGKYSITEAKNPTIRYSGEPIDKVVVHKSIEKSLYLDGNTSYTTGQNRSDVKELIIDTPKVTVIDSEYLTACSSLTYIELNDSITSVNSTAFNYCSNIKVIKGSKQLIDKSPMFGTNYRVNLYNPTGSKIIASYWVKSGTNLSEYAERIGTGWTRVDSSGSLIGNITKDSEFICTSLNPEVEKLQAPIINISDLKPSNREDIIATLH